METCLHVLSFRKIVSSLLLIVSKILIWEGEWKWLFPFRHVFFGLV